VAGSAVACGVFAWLMPKSGGEKNALL
jgi:hypothetical protein